ncbi:hypothetical protein HQ529_06305 [Candidatus Woesearchaeota archaeon]|nr:hypothetical protein [Candidatus Woesearchaeota archaeon]
MIKNREFFARGKRGIIYIAFIGKKKVGIKTKRSGSKAIGRIENEAKWMKILNKKGIGPKFVSFENNELIYEFVEGEFIIDYFEKSEKKDILRVLKDLMKQMREMDKLKVNKLEMHHPIKHVVVGKNVVLLDFERCHITNKPKNVTQLCQFIVSGHLTKLLGSKGIKINRKEILDAAKEYKKNHKGFNKIFKLIK